MALNARCPHQSICQCFRTRVLTYLSGPRCSGGLAVYHSEPAPEVNADRPANSLCYANDGLGNATDCSRVRVQRGEGRGPIKPRKKRAKSGRQRRGKVKTVNRKSRVAEHLKT